MAEGAGLENRYTGNGIVGSNPTLSVFISNQHQQTAKRGLTSALFVCAVLQSAADVTQRAICQKRRS